MDDYPTLTDVLQSGQRVEPQPLPVTVVAPPPMEDPITPAPHQTLAFLQFFWNIEELRQHLYEKFNYRVFRRIENYEDGTACVKLTCPPYGKGEPGSQSTQKTLAAVSGANQMQLQEVLNEVQDAMTFFVRRQEMQAVANDVISHLTPAQLEALRWTMNQGK